MNYFKCENNICIKIPGRACLLHCYLIYWFADLFEKGDFISKLGFKKNLL